MKKFTDVIIMNFRKILVPIMLLTFVTIAVQIGVYAFALMENGAYREYSELGENVYNADVLCINPVSFIGEGGIERWNVVGLISLIIGIMLILFCSKETQQNISIIRNLPVNRFILWLAKFVQVILSLLIIYCADYAAIFFQYMIYKKVVIEKFRTLFAFEWNNDLTENFFKGLGILAVIAIVISVIYSVKNYSIKTKKNGGRSNEEN